MDIEFWKFHGTGNDFILIDCREKKISLKKKTISRLCNRHTGIGADGLISIEKNSSLAFSMIYYNSDGNVGSMCGNGARCAVAFVYDRDSSSGKMKFEASDGIHEALIIKQEKDVTHVGVSLADVNSVTSSGEAVILDTGSPHYVLFVDSMNDLDVVEEGRKIRYSDTFRQNGINVNFVELHKKSLSVRTYERGVEWETLSCGTGVCAVAIAASFRYGKYNKSEEIKVLTRGGELTVSFTRVAKEKFTNIWLTGPAAEVFYGFISVEQ